MEKELQEAFSLFKQKNYAPAWEICLKILDKWPNQPDCLAMMGMMCNKAKRFNDAEKYLRKCLVFHPSKHIILTELATSLNKLEKYNEAEEVLNKSLMHQKNYEKTHIQLGILYKNTHRKSEAVAILSELLKIKPNSTAALNNLGTLYVEEDRKSDALLLFKKVIEIVPHDASAHKNIALIELHEGNTELAMNHFQQSLQCNPNDVDVLLEAARIYTNKNNYADAIQLLEKALLFKPNNDEILALIGSACIFLKQYEKAAFFLEKVVTANESNSLAFYMLAKCKCELCDWKNWDDTRNTYIQHIENELQKDIYTDCSTYDPHYLNIPDTLQFQLMKKTAEHYRRNALDNHQKVTQINDKHQKLRIGYLSPDFRRHAVGMIVFELFKYTNRELFESHVFSLHTAEKDDFFRAEIMNNADYFYDLSGLSYIESAKKIAGQEIDILVDFGGYTNQTQPEIIALKPAKIQMHMIGQPDSFAMPESDFFVADKILIDETNRNKYTENILYLPHGFFGSRIKPADITITRFDLGIPDDAFVFCSFCSPYKFEPTMFSIWMRLLREKENSVLCILANKNKAFKRNIDAFAVQHGIDPNRIIHFSPTNIEEHLHRMRLCDLFLDSLYYTASSTAIHALSAGLPLLTHCGETNAMRQAASVLHAAGLDELIVYSLDEYYQKAMELANNPIKVAGFKSYLLDNQNNIPLFDMKKNVQYLETAFLKMWEMHQNNIPFTNLYIPD